MTACSGAAQILRNSNLPMAFHGFVEGNDIAKGTVDVVVTDGFTGNIALKTAEGTARLVGSYLRRALKRSLLSQAGRGDRLGRAEYLAPQAGSARPEWRRFPGPERRGGEKPWRHRCGGLCQRRWTWPSTWPRPTSMPASPPTARAITAESAGARGRLNYDPRPRHRLRRLPAGQHRHQ